MTTSTKNLVVKPMPPPKSGGEVDDQPDPGSHLFKTRHCNVLMMARKNTGKTSAIGHILSNSVSPGTTVFIFAPTAEVDPVWLSIREMLEAKGVEVVMCGDDVSPTTLAGLKDLLVGKRLAYRLADEAWRRRARSGGAYVPPRWTCQGGGTEAPPLLQIPIPGVTAPATRDARGPAPVPPNHIVIFDDLGDDMRSRGIKNFLCKNRHMLAKVLISAHWPHDIMPGAWRQMDYAMIFGRVPDDKLREIHERLLIPHEYEDFREVYQKATASPHAFLYIDTRKDKMRENFDKKII